ncbi:MAG: Gfo/Idh/MocA family oxidoreductase [Kiritimatiellae bacterium]|nr:Gfo/Idh/MocA family oxidoreductase [Kiritimatiellia bacterium]
MKIRRRGFLSGAALAGAGAVAAGNVAGCKSVMSTGVAGGRTMMGFRAPALDEVRVGFIGVGKRGPGAVRRLSRMPKTRVVAVCDVFEDRAEKSAQDVAAAGHAKPQTYFGSEEAYKKLCERPDVNLVYVCTPWHFHVPMALYAMRCGKHVCVEVPVSMTVEGCWSLVETAEKTRRHCMMLENCCYGEDELFALMLARNGLLGELVHGDCGYIHELRAGLTDGTYYKDFALDFFKRHTGNSYPTHGLGPIAQYMGINRGDRFERLVSLSSGEFGLSSYIREKHGASDPRADYPYKTGDMSTTVIRTAKGRTIMVQYGRYSPRPYDRINLITGTKGTLRSYPLRVALDPKPHAWLDDKSLAGLKEKYAHPLWRKIGEIAKKNGGHGGMDYIMEYRLCHCLLNGLPLDQDVYDGAAWSSLVELTERSVLKDGASVVVPDFTRGAWRDAQPLGIVEV